ncbi:MAG TPA: secretin N-terminal domain-containing protein [Thermoanaerobaculia bacterium]|nr:secretin N-terminal domain-containing protein [Thermoanaerobaculia bacterium]
MRAFRATGRSSLLVLMACALLALAGCTSYRGYRHAQAAEATGDWDRAVIHYLELVAQNPSDLRYRTALLRAKIQASHAHFEQAKKYRDAGLPQQALVELQQSVQLDPTNQYARAELQKVREELDAQRAGSQRETLEAIKKRSQGLQALPPVLDPRSPEPIDLDFPEAVSVKQIYQALGKAFGINILFDPSLRDQALPIQLREVDAQNALEILMRTAGHFYKVLDTQSIIVVPDTPQNRRKYEDLIIQTFFLSNAEVKDVMTMLRSLVDSRKIAGNEQLNAIILRDTADRVKIAERIIRANDKAKAEVVVDVELLQLNTTKLQDLGVSLDAYRLGLELDTGGEDTPLRFSDLEFLNANNWVLTVPNMLLDFVKTSTDAQTLAKPQLRISEGEKARLNIGDRVPIPVTSFNTANTVGSNIVPITSFQYQDVGIIIEIEPRVHHNEEISLTVTIEVSNISGNIQSQPIIGSRRIETTIRLQDGETNFLAGLIRTDETSSEQGVPGLSDIPVLGRLFGKKRNENQRTDIVLTLTPHIIRRADITAEDLAPIWVGTEQNLTFRGGSPSVESDVEGPFDGEDPSAIDPAERVRERLRQLPPGLRDQAGPGLNPSLTGEEPAPEEPAPPAGVELVPGRRSPFDRSEPEEEPPVEEEVIEEEEPPRQMSQRGSRSPGGWQAAASSAAADLGTSAALSITASLGEPAAVGGQERRDQAERDQRLGVPTPAPVAVEVWPQSVSAKPGEIFSIELRLNAQLGVAHLPSRLRFDPAVVRFVSAAAGPLLQSAGTPQVLAHTLSDGLVVLGASLLGAQDSMNGGGTVLQLQFEALLPGSTRIRLAQTTPYGPSLEGRRTAFGRRAVDVAVAPDIGTPKPGDPALAPGTSIPEVLVGPDGSPREGAKPPGRGGAS